MISAEKMNNCSEETIELLAQNVIPQNLVDNGSAGYIKAEITAVLNNATENPTLLTIDDACDVLTTKDTSLQMLKDDPNELPYIARNLTWHDPFYENSHDVDDIIMAFDIDRTKYDTFWLPFVLAIFVPINFTFYWIDEDDFVGVVLFLIFLFSIPTCFACISDCDQRSKQFKIKRLHVALTRTDIYVDLVDRNNLMIRKSIPYHEVSKCVVEGEPSCWGDTMNFHIKLQKTSLEPPFMIDGIATPQRFVDIVSAMIKKSSEATRRIETPSSCPV
jgi:hypothetical protein